MKFFKRLYLKFRIWMAGPFKTRITRCNHCAFRVFNNDCDAYRTMIRHNLYGHCKTSAEQILYLDKQLEETKERLIKSLIENQNQW